MKTHFFFIVSLFAITSLFQSCQKSEWLSTGDYFFFTNDGATMPVWVKGNIKSGVFILTNHGGPGGGDSGHGFHISKGFKLLEEKYACIYWDQRMAGIAQGDARFEDLSVDQHVEDLEHLVAIIEEKYKPKSFFLLGHSWGGCLTGGYLGKGNNQHHFNGWINLDGSIQDEFEGEAKKEWIFDRIDDFYHKDPEYYQYIIDWYEEHPNPVENDWQPYTYVGSMNGYAYDWDATQEHSPIPYMELFLRSPFTFAFYYAQYWDVMWLNGYDVTEEVSKIEIPTLFLWGKEDGAVPPSTAQFAYDLLATPEADKEIILIEKCAHSPHYDTPEEFDVHMTNFIEKYK
jgi:proline iminopeptidase